MIDPLFTLLPWQYHCTEATLSSCNFYRGSLGIIFQVSFIFQKCLWERDRRNGHKLKVKILGSLKSVDLLLSDDLGWISSLDSSPLPEQFVRVFWKKSINIHKYNSVKWMGKSSQNIWKKIENLLSDLNIKAKENKSLYLKTKNKKTQQQQQYTSPQ